MNTGKNPTEEIKGLGILSENDLHLLQEAKSFEEKEDLRQANTQYQQIKNSQKNSKVITYLNDQITKNLQILRGKTTNKWKKFQEDQQQTCKQSVNYDELDLIEKPSKEQENDKIQTISLQFDDGIINIEKIVEKYHDISYSYQQKNGEKRTVTLSEIKLYLHEFLLQNPESTTKTINLEKIQKDDQYLKQNEQYILQKLIESQQKPQKKEKETQQNPENPEDFRQQEEEDEEETVYLDEDNILPQIENKNTSKLQEWKHVNEYHLQLYSKDDKILVNHLIAKGSQGSVYQGLDKNNNSFIIFKQFEDQFQYESEKEIYLKLQQNEKLKNDHILLDLFDYDDEYQLLKMPKAECTVLDYMKIRYKNAFSTQNNSENSFHLTKNEFISLLLFQIETLTELEKIGIYYQDNKPENILMKKGNVEDDYEFQQRYADFGAVFDTFKDPDCIQYPTFCSQFYFDLDLHNEKQGSQYTKKEIIANEIYTMARSLQKCLFPLKQHSELLQREKMPLFYELLEQNYDKQIFTLFKKMTDTNLQERYTTFQDLHRDINIYINNNNLKISNFWKDTNSEVKEFNEKLIESFYSEYFKNILEKQNEFQQIKDICQHFEENEMSQQCLQFIDICFNQNLIQSELDIASIQYIQGNCYFNKGEFGKCIEFFKKSLEIQEKQNDIDHEKIFELCCDIGNASLQLFELEQSKNYFLKSLKALELMNKEKTIDAGNIYSGLGSIENLSNRYEEAGKFFQKALEIIDSQEESEETKPIKASVLFNMGGVQYQQAKYEDAEKMYLQALKIQEELYGKDHIYIARTYNGLGNVADKNYERAKEYYQKAIKIYVTHHGEDAIQVSRSIHNLAKTYFNLEDYDNALKMGEKALKIDSDHYGSSDHKCVAGYHLLAKVYNKTDFKEKASEYYEKANRIDKEHHGDDIIKNYDAVHRLYEYSQFLGNQEEVDKYDKLLDGLQ